MSIVRHYSLLHSILVRCIHMHIHVYNGSVASHNVNFGTRPDVSIDILGTYIIQIGECCVRVFVYCISWIIKCLCAYPWLSGSYYFGLF